MLTYTQTPHTHIWGEREKQRTREGRREREREKELCIVVPIYQTVGIVVEIVITLGIYVI